MYFNDPTLYGVNFRDLPLQNSFPGSWPQYGGFREAAPQYGFGFPMVNTPQVAYDPYFRSQQFGAFQQFPFGNPMVNTPQAAYDPYFRNRQFGNFKPFPFGNPMIPELQSFAAPYSYGTAAQPWAIQAAFPYHNSFPGNQIF